MKVAIAHNKKNKEIIKHLETSNESLELFFVKQLANTWIGNEGIRVDEKPVSMEEFIESEEYCNCKGIIWPGVQEVLIEAFRKENDRRLYNEVVLDCGQGFGKGFVVSLAIARLTYEMSLYVNPQREFGLAPGTKMAVINVGTNSMQAKNVIFSDIKARIDNNHWFNKYCNYDAGIESVLRFPKDIFIIPGSSSETFPLGYNLYAAVMDEIAYWAIIQNSKKWTGERERDVAENIYDAMIKRLKTRFLNFYMMWMISSPRYVGDFLERKVEEARTNKKILAVRKSTWENKRPNYYSGVTFDDMVCKKVPIEYADDFRRNPERARRDLGALPSKAISPYFTAQEHKNIYACWNKERENPIDIYGNLSASFKAKDQIPRHVHVDLALNGCAAGFAMSHVAKTVKQGIEASEELPFVSCDLLLQVKAENVGGKIKFSKFRELIYVLQKRGFVIGGVSYDGWQSIDSIQQLEEHGINAFTRSLDKDRSGYETLKTIINDNRFEMPTYYGMEPFVYEVGENGEAVLLPIVIHELKNLEDIKGKIDHPPNGSKDVSDALAGSVTNAIQHFIEFSGNVEFGFEM